MKKVFFALLALSLGCVGFTSCENGKLEYTASTKTVTLTGTFNGEQVTYSMKEVQ